MGDSHNRRNARILFLLILRQPRSTFFPYTTLFRSIRIRGRVFKFSCCFSVELTKTCACSKDNSTLDRKSTRLNSSHSSISYAVFCLKKKKIVVLSEIYAQRPANTDALYSSISFRPY